MANTEVGSAYVTVYPQTDGKFSDSVGKSMGGSLLGGMKTALPPIAPMVATAVIGAATAAAAGLGMVVKSSFDSYADYEQLVGGVETLFKDSAGQVQAYAMNAYQTAGLSANEYMETVTSFSASLLQSLDGDTAAAAKYADTAIMDMSDNANKMGTDMASIQTAYQGFAKQNYTMLDNLKLGYGGTKSEMERLLADASKIAGVEFNIDNYSDVIEAIHVMQTSMDISGYSADELKQKLADMSLTTEEVQKVADDLGISYEEASKRMQNGTLSVKDAQVLLGTTAREAATTIQGSVSAMKGAWENWLVSLASEDVDFGATTDALLESIATVASNVLPRLGVIVSTIINGLPDMMAKVANAIPSLGVVIGDAVAEMLHDAFGVDVDMGGLYESISGAFSEIVGVVQGVYDKIAPIIAGIAADIQAAMPVVQGTIESAMNAVGAVVEEVWPNIQSIVESVTNIIATIVPPAWEFIKGTIATVMGNVQSVISAVWPVVSGIVKTATSAISSAVSGLSSIVSSVTSTFNAVKDAITHPVETARDVVKGIIEKIKGFFNFTVPTPHIPLPHFSVSPSGWQVGDLLKGSIPSLGISWYATGGFVDGATLIGAGEAGPEMILPQRGGLMDDFSDAVAARVDNQSVVDELRRFERMIGPIIADYAPGMTRREFGRAARTAVAYG